MSTYTSRKIEALRSAAAQTKLLSTSALTAAGLIALMPATALAVDDHADWDGINIVGGKADVTDTGLGKTNIDQHSMRAVGEAQELHIGKMGHVNIDQKSKGALFVARAIGDHSDPTQILGKLTADGQVMILDRNGVIFGADSVVDVAGIAASTGALSNADIMDGDNRFTFDNFGDGEIVLEGTINVADAGLAAFVSPAVSNSGVINAKLGTVAFAAGEKVTLDLYGDGLVEVTLEGKLGDALLKNTGTINAEGGTVSMTAQAAKDVVDNIINVDGIITVASAEVKGGKIVLHGGDSGIVEVSGTLDASGEGGGGSIDITGENVLVSETAVLDTSAKYEGDGGSIRVWGDRNSIFFGQALAQGGANSGDGGFVEVSAGEGVGYGGFVNTTAAHGETGTFLIDPENIFLGNYGLATTAFSILADVLSGGILDVLLDARALANTLAHTNVNLWATETITTTDDIDLSTEWRRRLFRGWRPQSITDHDLTLSAPVINLLHDIVLGTGGLYIRDLAAGVSPLGFDWLPAPHDINVHTVNLGGTISRRSSIGGPTTTASSDQLDGEAHVVNVLSNDAKIQQGLYFADTGAAVNVFSDTYTENLVIDVEDLKLTGIDDPTLLAADTGSPLITILSSSVNIDPFVFDGAGADYGIVATGAGADGLVVDGNTFKNFSEAGVFVANSSGGTATIKGNTFRGSSTRGVETGTLDGGFTLNIFNNRIGTAAQKVVNGLLFGRVKDATINIRGGRINSGDDSGDLDGDGIHFKQGLRDGSEVNITNVRIVSSDEAVDFDAKVRDGATVNITGGNYTGGNNGIALNKGIDGSVSISGATITGNGSGKQGINITGPITGSLEVLDSTIEGNDDAIGSGNDTSAVDGGTVTISGNTLTGINGDGVELGPISNGALVRISKGNTISGGENGINLFGGISGKSTVGVSGNTSVVGETGHGIIQAGGINQSHLRILNNDEIIGNNDAVHVEGHLTRNARVDIVGNKKIRGVTGNGIQVWDYRAGGSDVNISKNHVHFTGLNGIFAKNLNGVLISENRVHNTRGHGIYASNSDFADILDNTLWNIRRNGIFVNPSNSVEIIDNDITGAGWNGIQVDGGTGHNIRYNTIREAKNDGIKIQNFGNAWIAYNDIKWTGDDGIDARNGNFVSIYNNYVDLSGFLPGRRFGNVEVGKDANGIIASNIGGSDLPRLGTSEGFGYSSYGAAVEIYGNDIANVEDDGAQVRNSDSAYVGHNIIGHVGDDGVDIDNVDYVKVSRNAVTLAEDKGITIDGGHYAGVFGNRVLLTGNDGIQVENIRYDHTTDIALLGDSEYGYGWAVNVSGNQVAMTGDDAIEIRNSDATKVARNNIFGAGMGEGLSGVIETINDFANVTFNPLVTTSFDVPEFDYFTWNWGDGHGINVHGIGGAYYSPNGWAVDIRNNKVDWTGGHGILAENNDRTRIKNNRVRYSGIDTTTLHGASSMIHVLDNGPFGSEGRRDLWFKEGRSMIAVLNDYFGADDPPPEEEPPYEDYISIGYVDFDSHDGIHAENIYSQSSDGVSGANYLFDLKIVDNTVRASGDDNVEVAYAGRTLIARNTLRGAGRDYNSDDYYGADNIHARYITATTLISGPPPVSVGSTGDGSEFKYEPARNYALIIRNNDARRAGDDNVEVVGYGNSNQNQIQPAGIIGDDDIRHDYYYGTTDRVLIAENTLRNAGAHGTLTATLREGSWGTGYNVGADGYGHDNIHVRGINGTSFSNPGYDTATSGANGSGFYGYAVDVIGNTARRAGDDNVEVINSSSTLIYRNVLRNAGVGGGRYYDSGDFFGADAIHVRNVHSGGLNPPPPAGFVTEDNGFKEYSVVISNNLVNNAGDDGAQVLFSGDTRIANNEIYNVGRRFGQRLFGADGIHVLTDFGFNQQIRGEGFFYPLPPQTHVEIVGNIIDGALDDGVEVMGTNVNLLVDTNEILNSGDNGILLIAKGGYYGPTETGPQDIGPILTLVGPSGNFDSLIINNTVENSGSHGLNVTGGGHDDVVLKSNLFIDNPVGARFESGHVDVSDLKNPNAFVVSKGFKTKGPVVGLQFDPKNPKWASRLSGFDSPIGGSNLTIVDETLGGTIFSGFLKRPVGDAYYVRFEDGAILDPLTGDPIIIDGLNANFDGLVPAKLGGKLPKAALKAIEDRLWDADDPLLNGRGQIFVGKPSDEILGLENIEDFFNQFGNFNGGPNGLSVTITGLPSIVGGLGAQGLAGISPAAGGNGTSPEDLAGIEPSAGDGEGSDAACWGDAANAASTGGAVNYSFGGSFEESLADAANCGS